MCSPSGEAHTSRVSESRLKHYPGRARGTWGFAPDGKSQGNTALHVYSGGVADAIKVFWSGLLSFRGENLSWCLCLGRGDPSRELSHRGRGSDVAAAFNIDKPVRRDKVTDAKDTSHIIFHLYVSKKHLVQKPTYRSHVKPEDLQCVWKKRGKCLD